MPFEVRAGSAVEIECPGLYKATYYVAGRGVKCVLLGNGQPILGSEYAGDGHGQVLFDVQRNALPLRIQLYVTGKCCCGDGCAACGCNCESSVCASLLVEQKGC